MWKCVTVLLCLLAPGEALQLSKLSGKHRRSAAELKTTGHSPVELLGLLQATGAPAQEIVILGKQLLAKVTDSKVDAEAAFDSQFGNCDSTIADFAAARDAAKSAAETAAAAKEAAENAAAAFISTVASYDKIESEKNAAAILKEADISALTIQRASDKSAFQSKMAASATALTEVTRIRLIAQKSSLNDLSTHVNELGGSFMELADSLEAVSPGTSALLVEVREIAAKATPSELDSIYNLLDKIRDRIKDAMSISVTAEELAAAEYNSDKLALIDDANNLHKDSAQARKDAAFARKEGASSTDAAAAAFQVQVEQQDLQARQTQAHIGKKSECEVGRFLHKQTVADFASQIEALNTLLAAIAESGGLQDQLNADALSDETSNITNGYRFEVASWGECSRTCGNGTARRVVSCVTDNKGAEAVEDTLCGKSMDREQPCNEQPCCSGVGERSDDDKSCKCDEKYYYSDEECLACASGCHECSSSSVCDQPLRGFFLSDRSPKVCTTSMEGCAKLTACGDSADAQCAAAVDGNFVGSDGKSSECSIGCAKCTGHAACTEPLANYFVSGGVTKPWTVCNSGEFQNKGPTPTSDRQCLPITLSPTPGPPPNRGRTFSGGFQGARNYCARMSGWSVAYEDEPRGSLYCLKDGTGTGSNCNNCDSYRILVWKNGGGETKHDAGSYPFTTTAGRIYGSHNPRCSIGRDTLTQCPN